METALRREIAGICRRMYARGHVCGNEGNVSARLGQRHLLLTPSGVHKGLLAPRDLVRTDLQGRPGRKRGKPSSESRMHVAIYEERPDVGAIVHAHPAYAIALSVVGLSLERCVVAEAVAAFGGGVPTVPYTTPTTEDVAHAVRPYARRHDAFVLERHGTVTLGRAVEEAWIRLELLEQTAKITALAHLLGGATPLPEAEVARILGLLSPNDR